MMDLDWNELFLEDEDQRFQDVVDMKEEVDSMYSLPSMGLIDIEKDPVLSESLFGGTQPTQSNDFLYPSELDSVMMMPNHFHGIGDLSTGTSEVAADSGEILVGASTSELGSPTPILVLVNEEHLEKGTEENSLALDDSVINEIVVNIKQEPLDTFWPGPSNDQMREVEEDEEKEEASSSSFRVRAPRRRQPKKQWSAPADVDLVDLDELDNCVMRVRPKREKVSRKRVPEEEKDEEYYAKRMKNTLAARRSRRKKRAIDEARVDIIKSLYAQVLEMRKASAELEEAEKELKKSERELKYWKDLVEKLPVIGHGGPSQG